MDFHIHRRIHTHILTRANATAIPVLARINITQITQAIRHVRHPATTSVTTLATIRTPARTGLARTMIAIHAEMATIQAAAHTRVQLHFRTEDALRHSGHRLSD